MRMCLSAVFALAVFVLPIKAQALDVQEVTSPGGITAWLVEEPSIPMVSVAFEFRGGAAADPKGKEGLAYLTASLLNEGAGDMDALAFQTALDERAISIGFDARRDQFSGTLRTLSDETDEAFRLLGLALTAPRFDADAIERVREQVYAVQRHEAKRPGTVAMRAWMKETFDDHPYGRNPKGTSGSVAGLTGDDLRAYVADNLARDRLFIAVVGDITPDHLAALLDKTFGPLPATAAQPLAQPPVVDVADGITIIDKPLPQSVAIFGLPGIKRDDQDWFAATVMNYVLGSGGFSSRLMEEVRRKRGLTYGVYSYLLPMEQAGLLMGSVATVNDRMNESITVIENEIARMAEGGITDQELADAQMYLTGSYPLSFATNGAIAGQLVGIQRHGLGMDYINTRNSLVDAVTAEDVARVARRLLDPDSLSWVIVGQPTGLENAVTQDQAAP